MIFEQQDFTSTEDLVASLAMEGFRRRAAATAAQRLALAEATKLIADVRTGRSGADLLQEIINPQREYVYREAATRYPRLVQLRETMKTSDFSGYLTTDLINIMLWGSWQSMTNPVKPLVKIAQPLEDFKTVKRLMINGDGSPFEEDKSDGQSPAPQGTLLPLDPVTYVPKSYSKKMSIDWKALLNDNLGIFEGMTNWLVTGWNNTVWDFITKKFWDANGPNVLLYKAGNTNLITTTYGASVNNPPLSFQGIADGYTVLRKQLGPDGQPIQFSGQLYLVVPPALEVTALAIKNAIRQQLNVFGGKLNASGFPEVTLEVAGGVIPDFQVIVDQRIPLVTTAGTVANTAWLLVYAPGSQPRPAVELAFVRGFDIPTIMQRVPDTMRAGGGVDMRMGAFDSGQIDYKAVLAMGGAYGGGGAGQSTVASFGQ